jgi:hypothetical protein
LNARAFTEPLGLGDSVANSLSGPPRLPLV